MILFHGSNTDILRIDLSKCKPYKDFGKGFYLTTIRDQAERMAVRVARMFGGIPMVNVYEFDNSIMSKHILRFTLKELYLTLKKRENTMSKQEQLIEYITSDLVSFIMEDSKIPLNEALQRLYTSQTFAKLNDVETGLYLESPLYVYDIYKTEKEFGHIVQQEI